MKTDVNNSTQHIETSGISGITTSVEITSPARVHQIVRKAIRDGRLKKSRCVFCKSTDVIAHHQDYSKPLDVMWMCRSHHNRWHLAMKQSGGGPKNRALSLDLLYSEKLLKPQRLLPLRPINFQKRRSK